MEREYGLGRMHTDLLVVWPYDGGVQKAVLELKVVHGSVEGAIGSGLEQTWEYMDRCDTVEGHMVIFDRDEEKPWNEKIFRREEVYRGMQITVWGM